MQKKARKSGSKKSVKSLPAKSVSANSAKGVRGGADTNVTKKKTI